MSESPSATPAGRPLFHRLDLGDARATLAAQTIERLRAKLLDLTGRNPLLNYRHSDRARAQVRVIDELPDFLFSRLGEGKALAFRALESPRGELRDEDTDAFQMTLEAARLEDEKYLDDLKKRPDDDPNDPAFVRMERALRDRVRATLGLPPRPDQRAMPVGEYARQVGLNPSFDLPQSGDQNSARHLDAEIQTLLFPDRMQAKLTSLREGARRSLEETGINTLYAAYGFLEWYEAPHSEKPMYAPLLLQPLEIERVSHHGRWRYFVKGLGEEATINITLATRLKQDFGLDLPGLAEDDTPETYFVRVGRIVALQHAWRIRRFVTFGLFSFSRLAMWYDLDPARWPEKAAPATNSVVVSLLAGGAGGEGVDAPEYEVDSPELAKRLPPLILDADSSQISAVIDALEGVSLAIKGPPGTGKSQTITNFISAAVAQGKKVLFVAEKMAALDVVKKRLDQSGLGHFVFELHSTKAKKSEVLNSLRRRLEQQEGINAPREITDARKELERLRQRLTAYVSLLNRPFGATGKSIQEILWAAQQSQKSATPEALGALALDNVEEMTRIDLESGQAILESFEIAAADLCRSWGALQNHPWSWVEEVLSPFEHEALLEAATHWHDSLGELIAVGNEVEARFPNAVAPTIESLEHFCCVLEGLPGDVPVGLKGHLLSAFRDAEVLRSVRRFHDTTQAQRAILDRHTASMNTPAAGALYQGLIELAQLVNQLGVSEHRAGEVQTLEEESKRFRNVWKEVELAVQHVHSILGVAADHRNSNLPLLLEAVHLVANAPHHALSGRRPSLAGDEAREHLQKAARRAAVLVDTRRRLDQRLEVARAGSTAELRAHANALRQASLFGRLQRRYREAKCRWRDLLRIERRATRRGMAADLEMLANHLEDANAFSQDRHLVGILGSDFRGFETDFAPFQAAADFLHSVRRLTLGPTEYEALIRAALFQADAERLERVATLAAGPSMAALRRACNILQERATTVMVAVLDEVDTRLEDLRLLVGSVNRFGIARDVKLHEIAEIAKDMARLNVLEIELEQLASVEARIRAHDTDPANDTLAIESTLTFAELLWDRYRKEYECIREYLLVEDGGQRLTSLRVLARLLRHTLNTERAARDTTLLAANASGREFASRVPSLVVEEIRLRVRGSLDQSDAFGDWNRFLRTRTEVEKAGLSAVIAAYVPQSPSHLSDAYTHLFWRSLARRAFERHPDLKTCSGVGQDDARRRFRILDKKIQQLTAQELAAGLCRARLPAGSDRGPKSAWTELALIQHQVQLSKPRIAIRDLIRRGGWAIQNLKPCWMMSPSSVAQFLDPSAVGFDVIVIDEASQMRPEEAIGGIARSRQAVVVGDPMQLPPTTFFDRAEDFDDEVEERDVEEESILDMALGIFHPFRHLRWHYRSRHESLIAFSNQEFYENRLIVFPSPTPEDENLGVRYHKVNGVYRGRGGNSDEVKVVAEAAIEAMRRYPKSSLGVVAVNREQAELLRLEIDRLVIRNEDSQEYIARWETTLEPFFVKNLENVQGDERDSLLISTVYGPNDKGEVMQRFGPINQKTGHRRLNVLFTRAKQRVEVFSSMTSAQVRDDERSSWGVKALKGYLEFAATGRLERGIRSGREPDSDFEVFVADALRAHGYGVVPQVGVAGFYIDLGVTHPGYEHGFLAGVECDGATYHAAKSARDRDSLRQEVLEGLGWRLYRIWSTDWFSDAKGELEKLCRYLDGLASTRARLVTE